MYLLSTDFPTILSMDNCFDTKCVLSMKLGAWAEVPYVQVLDVGTPTESHRLRYSMRGCNMQVGTRRGRFAVSN